MTLSCTLLCIKVDRLLSSFGSCPLNTKEDNFILTCMWQEVVI